MTKEQKITNDSKVILEVKLGEYHKMAKTINSHLQTLYRLVIIPEFKKALIKDMQIIKTILKKSEKGVK